MKTETLKRCARCVMPNTRPGLHFNEQGICQACLRHEARKHVDWKHREHEFSALCAKYRRGDGKYDCIIPVSGGKDSHYQVYIMKDVAGMNPLLVNVSNFSWTETGQENYKNMLDVFDCECLSLDLSPATAKKMFRYSFEKYGSPTWYWDRAVYTYPLFIAQQFNIPLVVYGENISYEYGGPEAEDTPSAIKQMLNNVAGEYTAADYISAGIDPRRVRWMENPLLNQNDVDPIYLSYYMPWSGSRNRAVAEAYGFKPLNRFEQREGYIEQYDQIDAIGYLVHCWMKYPKYGHARATDVASYWIREGLMSRERAMELVKKHDSVLDDAIREDFCQFCGYSDKEFWDIVDTHRIQYVDE